MAKTAARAALFFITKSVLRPHAQKLRLAGRLGVSKEQAATPPVRSGVRWNSTGRLTVKKAGVLALFDSGLAMHSEIFRGHAENCADFAEMLHVSETGRKIGSIGPSKCMQCRGWLLDGAGPTVYYERG